MPDPFHLNPLTAPPRDAEGLRQVLPQHRLSRLLAFTGWSLDDLVNNAVAKRHIALYFKHDRAMRRWAERVDLERQWNPLGRSG